MQNFTESSNMWGSTVRKAFVALLGPFHRFHVLPLACLRLRVPLRYLLFALVPGF